MKKVIRLTENDLTNIIKRVIKEQSSSFKAEAVVEGDMLMNFPVVNITNFGGAGGIRMVMINPTTNKQVYVENFKGPIYDVNTRKKVYTSSSFQNINEKNYVQIAKSKRIPTSVATV